MAQVAELLLDFESLFNLYTREAVCLNVAGRGIQKLETQQKPEIENEEMTTLNPGNGEYSQRAIQLQMVFREEEKDFFPQMLLI